MSEFDKYAEMIKRMADRHSPEGIGNSDKEHAVILIRNLFERAKNEVRIFSSSISTSIWDDPSLQKSMGLFLENSLSNRIRVILNGKDDPNNIDNACAAWLLKTYQSQFHIHHLDKSYTNSNAHFIVMDRHGYRFCPDTNFMNSVATFNDPAGAANLTEQFDQMWKIADKRNSEEEE